jgi:DNA-binding LacI/PurR family transcriptional regulator/DNA-binding transcriptional regulator YhcF (GntR family)
MIRTAGRKARAYLEQVLSSAEHAVLPPLNAMAEGAGVSRMTMWKAVRELCRQGTVHALNARGYLPVGRPSPQSPARTAVVPNTPPSPAQPRWVQVQDHLLAQIKDGTMQAGSLLPPLKVLRSRLHTSYASLTPALGRLVSQGLLERHGKGWCVHAVAPARGRATLCVIGREPHARALASMTPRAPRLWTALEDECRRLNVRLDVRGIEQCLGPDIDTVPRPDMLLSYHRKHEVLGYLVLTLGIWPRAFPLLHRALAKLRCPAAFLRETDELAAGDFTGPARFAFYENAVSTSCGEAVGRYLFGLGHRQLAFFTTVASDQILYRRFEGLSSFYAAAGCPDAVSLRQYAGKPSYEQMLRDQAHSRQSSAMLRFDRKLAGMLEDQLGAVPQTIQGQLLTLRRHLQDISRTSYVFNHASPAFAGTAAQRAITAWVCADDPTALLALDWCRQNGVRVPGAISIVGFDDSEEALGAGLTSYNFNQETTVRAMIAHVMGRRRAGPPATRDSGGLVELPGFVSERTTCGAARKP